MPFRHGFPSKLLAAAALLFAAASHVQAQGQGGPGGQTGFPVALNTVLSNSDQQANPNRSALIVVAWCNWTLANKGLEARVSPASPPTAANRVASESGVQRMSLTFVVPWGHYYLIRTEDWSGLTPAVGLPPGGVCEATAWTR